MKPICRVTHPQISAGACPWCGCVPGESEPRTDATEPVWNLAAMAAALDDADEEVRSLTVTNLCHEGPPLDAALPLLSQALADRAEQIREMAEQGLMHLGRDLTAVDAYRLEEQIPGSEQELALRILILSALFLGQRESESARATRNVHVFWVIQHAPESETAGNPLASLHDRQKGPAYSKAKQLWLDQVQSHPDNAKILGNAANFFLLCEPPLSEDLFKQARDLEPSNPEWPERLAQLYSLHSRRETAGARTSAAHAFEQLKAADQLRHPHASESEDQPTTEADDEALVTATISRVHHLPNLAKAAFEAREFEQARNYAVELLEKASSTILPEFFRNDGDAIHHGNLILGRVALQAGDVEGAKRYLLAAGKTKGSPPLGSFGPNMSLAKELLEAGERDTVLSYFELCRAFWKMHENRLDYWAAEVRAGRIPQFGPNLVY